MKKAVRWMAALLPVFVVLAALPQAQAVNISQDDVKKIAIAGTAVPKTPQVDIPGASPEKPAANKKEAKKAAREKADAAKQAADEAFSQVEAMAKTGDIQAQYILGIAYYTGRQVDTDDKAAVEWWRRASISGHPDASAYVGLAYAEGFGDRPKSPAEAERRYLRAEQDGSALARVLLGIDGYKTNMPADKAAAVKRFRTAAQQGNPQAKDFLQKIGQKGTDVKLDFGENLDWKKEAEKTPLTELYTQAGTNAFWGRLVAQDYAAAVRWWQLAASQDYAAAQALLGTAYYTGRGVEQDEKTAVALFKTAAAQNEPLAQYMLGKAYLAGNVVQKNKELALKLFRAAGAAGIADAQQQADRLEKEG